LLLDASAADKLFDLKALEPQGSIGFVEAKSKKPDAAFTDLRVAIVALQPRELTWRDALQNVNTIRFESLSKNGKLAADAFAFTPPKGADVLKQ
jgi:outer membrane lipoprotein carrier protein